MDWVLRGIDFFKNKKNNSCLCNRKFCIPQRWKWKLKALNNWMLSFWYYGDCNDFSVCKASVVSIRLGVHQVWSRVELTIVKRRVGTECVMEYSQLHCDVQESRNWHILLTNCSSWALNVMNQMLHFIIWCWVFSNDKFH